MIVLVKRANEPHDLRNEEPTLTLMASVGAASPSVIVTAPLVAATAAPSNNGHSKCTAVDNAQSKKWKH